MPEYQEKTEPYEVLIRFENGAYRGAHYQEITTILRDGQPIPGGQTIGPAIPIKDAPRQTLVDVMGLVAVEQALTVDRYIEQLAGKDVELAERDERIAELEAADAGKLQLELEAANANAQVLLERIAELEAAAA